MAVVATSLSAACSASDTTLAITSTSSGFPAVGTNGNRQLALCDAEYMLIESVPVANTIKVLQRGYNGTSAVAHGVLAPFTTSATAGDMAGPATGHLTSRPQGYDDIVSIGANGVIAVPAKNTTVLLVKATALSATTLGAPGLDQNGLRLTITNQTAAAHVITATSLISDGVTGGAKSTLTFGAFVGASIVLEADNGLWNVISAVVCPVT